MTRPLLALAAALVAGAAGAEPVPMSQGGAVAPPAPTLKGKSGKARYEIRGCLAVKGEEKSRPFEIQPGQRTLPQRARVDPAPGGARVRHPLTHACCLTGSVKAKRIDGVWEVRETLSGTPCRCQCASTLETFLTLPPGKHRVRVVVLRGAEREVAGEWPVELP